MTPPHLGKCGDSVPIFSGVKVLKLPRLLMALPRLRAAQQSSRGSGAKRRLHGLDLIHQRPLPRSGVICPYTCSSIHDDWPASPQAPRQATVSMVGRACRPWSVLFFTRAQLLSRSAFRTGRDCFNMAGRSVADSGSRAFPWAPAQKVRIKNVATPKTRAGGTSSEVAT